MANDELAEFLRNSSKLRTTPIIAESCLMLIKDEKVERFLEMLKKDPKDGSIRAVLTDYLEERCASYDDLIIAQGLRELYRLDLWPKRYQNNRGDYCYRIDGMEDHCKTRLIAELQYAYHLQWAATEGDIK